MAVQKFAQKRRTACYKQARSYYRAEQDKATDDAVAKAVEASKRARNLLRELKDI